MKPLFVWERKKGKQRLLVAIALQGLINPLFSKISFSNNCELYLGDNYFKI